MKVHSTPCKDPDCFDCHWTLAGEIKDMCRVAPDSWDRFCDFLSEREPLNLARWEDRIIYLHTSLNPKDLEEWADRLYCLKGDTA